MADDQNQEPVKNDIQIDEYKEKYLRALADYQNLERQTADWKQSFITFANVELIKKLLEVLDDLEKAQDHLKDSGLELVIGKLKTLLQAEGLEVLDLEGKDYSPEEAEVVSTQPDDKPNKVLKILQKGYKLKDKVIRPAKVIVSIK